MTDVAAANFRSPSVRRWLAAASIVELVIEDLFNVTNHLLGANIRVPEPVVIATLVLFACGCIAFLSWIWRAHKNLWELGVGGIEVTPGWALGWWFIPIANLFKPYLSMRELWWASDPSDEPSRGLLGSGSALPLVWWLTFILFNVTLSGVDVPALVNTVMVVSALAGVISATCILAMMWSVDARQRGMNAPDADTAVPPLLR